MADRTQMLLDAIDRLALQYTGQDLDEMLADGYSDAEGEQKLRETLVRATRRFLLTGRDSATGVDTDLYSMGFSAAEQAILTLIACGLARSVRGCLTADWTDEGRRLLAPTRAK